MYIFTPCLMNFDMQPGDLVAWVIKHLSENNARKKKIILKKKKKNDKHLWQTSNSSRRKKCMKSAFIRKIH